ncbi:hypothetical protein V2A85_14560 [Yersinia sp. 1252 StPb PI]|uniref:hypothetical protein n=1 Tax=Yersinia sp. 1252 StPb PI TaxID=3117404 RepID=UPI003B288DD6
MKNTWQHVIGTDEISRILVTDKSLLSCDIHCVIAQKMVIPLSAIFSRYTVDAENKRKSILLSFEVNDGSFNMSLNDFIDITADDNRVSILPPNKQQLDFPIHQGVTHISFLFSWYNNELLLNYLETLEGELLNLSPTISILSQDAINSKPFYLSIFNGDERQPLVMQKVLMAIHSQPQRTKRGASGIAGCFLSGPLALYNIITHGRCDQVESAWGHIKALFAGEDPSNRIVVGSGEPLKPHTPLISTSQEPVPPTLVLTQIQTHLHEQSLTLPAVARHCQTPLDNVIGLRYPRQIRHLCSPWLSSVLADFTLLFGGNLRTWSTEYLIQTLNNILDRGTIDNDNEAIDAFIHQPVAGNRLIQTVNDVAEEQGRSAVIDSITQSFGYAEQNYANYAITNSPQGATADSSNESTDDSCSSESDSDSDDSIASPRQAQQYPLGSYEMPISSYIYQDVLPRILRNGEWVVPPERFDIEVIQGESEQSRRQIYELLATIAEWENTYHEQRVYCNHHGIFPTAMATNRYAGQATSRLIKSYAQRSSDNQSIIVVRFNHQIVSVSIAHSYLINQETHEKHGTIATTLTHPTYVLTPDAEGTIRGAGSAALHATIQHLKAEGITLIEAEVISTPSAIVKKRIGFNFNPYKFGPVSSIPTQPPTAPPHVEL